jgi:hypothetical protein
VSSDRFECQQLGVAEDLAVEDRVPSFGDLTQLRLCSEAFADRAIAESVMRSAHNPPHHARSSGVAKHHTEAPAATSSKPAACAHARRNRPASGSPALRRVMVR